ncbi:PQQ-binding-like beta-propeller repeat protein [Paenibacillus donghaensis]|uniref:outer membrane protein assembly factor BamB family protein n=1 Tax=Paenibacillus donghaensis TaxID=414771 RepID=UPI0018838B01|nr:PQQ-binding-like beta-propeller repeat protein [Paenibacillus donghaensis]MBE9917644.1 PQQ-binding-like beta-propeller repeat protein [Paenibacillus donghaensis]
MRLKPLKPLKLLTKSVVLMGLCAVLFLMLCAGELSQSFAASSSKQVQPAGKLAFQFKTPYFQTRLTETSPWTELKAADYGRAGETVKAKSGLGELALVTTDSSGDYWIPGWYTTQAAKSIRETAPAYVSIAANAKLSLTPGSRLKWAQPNQGMKLIALANWKDWVGVMISPREWHKDDKVFRPVLLWVNAKSITSKEAVPDGILTRSSDVPIDVARELTEIRLDLGDSAAQVQKLLGAPDVKERSANFAHPGEAMKVGTAWRYERPQAQFTISFSEQGKLMGWKWILPANEKLELGVYPGSNYGFAYDFIATPAAFTLNSQPVWKNQGNLNYAYLVGSTDQVLLVNGDDGGFSGMHHDSSIYAVDRNSGRKLWQVDAGFGIFNIALDRSRDTAAVYTEYDPAKKKYEGRIRELNLKDGRVIWEKQLSQEQQVRMHAVKDAVLLYRIPASDRDTGSLTVLDRATGKQKWNRTLGGKQRVLETAAEDPYILIQEGLKLRALSPENGKEIWSVTGKGEAEQDPQANAYFSFGNVRLPLQPQPSSRWFLVGGQWMLLDTGSGEVLAEYAWNRQERFETTNDQRYILVQRSDGLTDYDSSKVKETILYDVFGQRSIWSLPGKAVSGMFDQDRLYVVLDGLPAAVDRYKGTLLWQMPLSVRQSANPYTLDEMAKTRFAALSQHLLLGYGSDLLVLGKQDGQVQGRLKDVLMAYSEARYRNGIEGLLNITGNEIYIGSSNGGLARYNAAELERLLR